MLGRKSTQPRKTAGEMQNSLRNDHTRYDPLEVGHALTDGMAEQLRICAEAHDKIFDMAEYCLVRVVAGDPLLKNLQRHKYYAYPLLPMPRPQQAVFLYNKAHQTVRRLWSLPSALVMATISEMPYVAPQWKSTKVWADAFFTDKFHQTIREMHGIDMLSRNEYLHLHREELAKAGFEEESPVSADPLERAEVTANKVIDALNSLPNKDLLDS